MKKLSIVLFIIFIFSCMEESFERTNIYDPQGSDYIDPALSSVTIDFSMSSKYHFDDNSPVYIVLVGLPFPMGNPVVTNDPNFVLSTSKRLVSNSVVVFDKLELPTSASNQYLCFLVHDTDNDFDTNDFMSSDDVDFEYFYEDVSPSNVVYNFDFNNDATNELGIMPFPKNIMTLGNSYIVSINGGYLTDADNREPNDEFIDATTISPSTTLSALTITPGDVDYFILNANVDENFTIYAAEYLVNYYDTNTLSNEFSLSLSLWRYNNGSGSLDHIQTDDSGKFGYIISDLYASSYTYYLKVRGQSSFDEGDYSIRIEYSSPTNDLYEDDNVTPNSNFPLYPTYASNQVHTIEPMYDYEDKILIPSQFIFSTIPIQFYTEKVSDDYIGSRDMLLSLNLGSGGGNLFTTPSSNFVDLLYKFSGSVVDPLVLTVACQNTVDPMGGKYRVYYEYGPDEADYDYFNGVYKTNNNNSFVLNGSYLSVLDNTGPVATNTIYPTDDIDTYHALNQTGATKNIRVKIESLYSLIDTVDIQIVNAYAHNGNLLFDNCGAVGTNHTFETVFSNIPNTESVYFMISKDGGSSDTGIYRVEVFYE